MPPAHPADPDPGIRELLRGLPVFAGPLGVFEVAEAPDEPVALFRQWLAEAIDAGVPEPHATTLSTVDDQGRPSGRTLIVKNVDSRGWQFAFSAVSRKGAELAHTPWAALTFYWPGQGRQIRVRGAAVLAPAAEAARDFLARPAGSRAAALLERQSRPLADRSELDTELRRTRAAVERQPDLVAPSWRLYTVRADEVEFWQGDRERRHTRLRYQRTDVDTPTWHKEQLWP